MPRYAVAVGCVLAGAGARQALSGWVGPTELPFIFFFPAVACAAWYGGLAPGALSAALAALLARWFFIEPRYSLAIADRSDLAPIAAFLFSCAFIVGAIEAMHGGRRSVQVAHDLLATTLASIGDGVIVTDGAGRVTFLNAEAARLTRWSQQDAHGKALTEVFRIIAEDGRRSVEDPGARALRTGHAVGLANHTILVGRDGAETPIDDSAAPILGEDGTAVGVVLVFRDVTEARKAEGARARLAAVVEGSGDAIFTKDLDGTLRSWNLGAERLFGYRADEVVGQSITRLVPPDLLAEEQEILGRLRAGLPSERLETVRLAKDGRRLDVAITASPLRDAHGAVIGASTIMHDIGERKRAQRELVDAKDKLATELLAMQRLYELGALLLRETDVSSMLHRVLDASVELLRARRGVVQLVDREAQTLRIVASVGFEDAFLERFGTVPIAGGYLSSAAALHKRRLIVEDFEADRTFAPVAAGAAAFGIRAAQSTPLFAADGQVFGILSTHFDVPHRPGERDLRLLDLYAQQAERVIDLREAREALHRANTHLEDTVRERTAELQATVSELQHVSYAIAHDMRAPLRAMSAFAQLLVEDATEPRLPPDLRTDYCRRIQTGAGRLDALIRDALSYTKTVLQRVPMGPVDLDPLVRGLIDTYPNLHPEKADIRIEGRLPVVRGNPALLTQVFSNLLGNAVKFVPPDRRAVVRVLTEDAPDVVRIVVVDNGVGIAEHARPRLFGMFQKLDAQFEGTGTGLAIVRKVVEQMGGAIRAESTVDRGSRFVVELPLLQEETS